MEKYASILSDGIIVPQDKKESTRYYKKAADKGSTNAMFIYALRNLGGLGIPENKHEAAKYFKMAGDNGYENGFKMYISMIHDGLDVDKRDAAKYLKISADKGDALSMRMYGIMLLQGDGVPENDSEAMKYIFKAALAGDEPSIKVMNSLKKIKHFLT